MTWDIVVARARPWSRMWWTPETEFDAKANRWVGQPSRMLRSTDFLDAVCPTVLPVVVLAHHDLVPAR